MGILEGRRIVFVLAGEVLGGAERGAIELATGLRDVAGAETAICALDDRPGPASALAASREIPWTSLRAHWSGRAPGKTKALGRFTLAARRRRPDVLVASTNAPNVLSGLVWRATGAGLAVWTQCDVNGSTRFGPRVFRTALRATPVVVTGACHGREWLVRELGADPRRVHVVRSVVAVPPARDDRAAWRARLDLDDAVVACMIAHLHTGKDHGTALRAWRTVVDQLGPEARPTLLLAGRDAGRRTALEGLVAGLGLHRHVHFLGAVDDIGGLLGASDLAVFCSHRELMPRGVTEPMAAGLAVAATDEPGTTEAMGEPGRTLVVPPGDAEGLARHICLLATDPARRARVGRANAELIRARHSRESSVLRLATLLCEELARRE